MSKNYRLKGLLPNEQKETKESNEKWDFGTVVNGQRQIDNLLGFSCYTLGYNRPDLIDYVCDNLKNRKPEIGEQFASRVDDNFLNDVTYQLTDTLYDMSNGYRMFFSMSGSDANEGAIKLAAAYHKLKGNKNKKKIVSFKESYHGSTYLTQGLGLIAMTDPYYSLDRAPFVKIIKRNFATEDIDWSEVACIMVESCAWLNELNADPPEFWKKLDDIRKEHDVLIIVDDVFMGGGKTGNWFGWQHLKMSDTESFKPDIFTMGKAITGGFFQLAITLYSEKIAEQIPERFNWDHGYTYSFCLPGILSVLKTMEILKHENVFGNNSLTNEHGSRFDINNTRARNIFESNGYTVVNQLGNMFNTTDGRDYYFYIIPFTATDEYFDVLEKETKR